MQEALYAQENQLNMERNDKNQLQVAIMNEKEEKNKMQERMKQLVQKSKKYDKVLKDSQALHSKLQDKSNQISMLNSRLTDSQSKNGQFQKINDMNKDLVTKNCALKSAVENKDKQNQSLQDKVRELEAVVMRYEQNSENVALMNSQVGQRTSNSFTQQKTQVVSGMPARIQDKAVSVPS